MKLFVYLRVVFIGGLIIFSSSSALFAQCGCDFTIPPGTNTHNFDGTSEGVQPGDVICISAGSHKRINFSNITGSPTNYVIIKNCGGQALVGGPNSNSAILFARSQYFRLTGTGDPGFNYGIMIPESRSSSQGVHIFDLSSDFEVDHLEITQVGFAGIMAKSDPGSDCLTTYERPNFVMKNLVAHDNYIHDIRGEGNYFGNSFYRGTTIYCGSRTQYSHEVRGVRIYNNIFENTGWESIQVGGGVDDVEIYNNQIYGYGWRDISSQNGGIQIGEGSIGKVYNNFIKDGTGKAIFVQGLGDTQVFNNVIINPGSAAIQMALLPTPLATDIVPNGFIGPLQVINNTIVNPETSESVKESLVGPPGNVMINNLVVGGPSSDWLKLRGDTDWDDSHNLYIPLIGNAGFTNPGLDDYSLLSSSPAVNSGRDASAFGVTFDIDNKGRPAGGSWDIGAYELSGNQKPNVSVGATQNIILPTNSTTITGSATDSDGTIDSYLWTKQSGPTVTITNQTTTTVNLASLLEGVYIFRLTATDNGGETGFKEVTITVVDPSVNQAPVANSGGNKSLTLPSNTTVLSGSANDPDGTISSYAWSKISGPAATLANAATATLTVSNAVQGTYVFRLTATDDDGATGTSDATITVNPAAVNQPPTANAGSSKNLVLPTSSTSLAGSGSDPDGSISTYLWTKQSGPAATLTNANTPTLQLTGLVVGSYVFRLTVTDNNSATGFAEVNVNVTASNQAPTANAGGNKAIQLPTSATTLSGSGSDLDGTISSYTWTKISGPAATLTNTSTSVLSLSGLVQGVYVFRLTVTDNNSATGSDNVTLNVQAANLPPTANAGTPKTITLPVNTTTLSGSGADPDGTIASYLWEKLSGPTATLTGGATATLNLSNLIVGSYTFRLTVTDNNGATANSQVAVVVLPVATNQAPTVSAGSNITITLPTNSTTINGSANDPDGTIANYLWTKISGPTATLTGTTLASLSLTNLVAGTYVFRLTATDNQGASTSDDVDVVVTNINQPPTVVASNDETLILPSNSTSLIAAASDPDGTITTYAWANLSGPSAPTMTGATTSTLNVSDLIAGTYVFRIIVIDNDGGSAFDQVNVIVQTSTNISPIAMAGSDVTIFLPTSTVTLNGTGTDADGTISAYAWTQIAGAASTLSGASTQTLSVSALTNGTYSFRLTVTDNQGATGISDVNVTVNLSSANQSPIANAGNDQNLTLPNNSSNLIGSGSDPDGAIANYNWIKLSGPSVTLSNENTPVLSIQNMVTGVYVFRLTVTDNNGAMGSDNVQVTIFPTGVNQSPTVIAGNDMTILLPTNTATIDATASDPDGNIATYSWTKQIGPSATISGEGTSSLLITNLVAGNYVFRITVTDNTGASSFDEMTVAVLTIGSNVPPVVVAGIDKLLFLPNNTINLMGQASDADGTIINYSWEKIGGPSVTLANQGTPNVTLSNLIAGQYIFRLTATDDQGTTGFDETSVTVFPGTVNQSPIADTGGNKSIALPTTFATLSGSGFDNDGSIVSFSWTQVLGPPTTITNISSPTLLVNGLSVGVFQFQLTVEDDEGAIGSSIAQVSVVGVGALQPPIANAGLDKVINLPQNSLDIQGSGSDPDGSISSYSWTKKSGPAGAILNGTTTSKLLLSDLVEGTYQFTLMVTDNDNLTNVDDISVTVIQATVNKNPVVNAGTDIFIRLPANSTSIDATATDIDGSIVSQVWSKQNGPAATLTGINTTTLSLADLVLGTYLFRIEVSDNEGATASADIGVIVLPEGVNTPPIVHAGSPKRISIPSSSTTLNGSVSDTDGFIALAEWSVLDGPNTPLLSGINTTTLSVQNLVTGLYTFKLSATDNENATSSAETTVEVSETHLPPVVFAGNDTTLLLPNNFMYLNSDVREGDDLVKEVIWTQTQGTEATIVGEFPDLALVNLLPDAYTFRLTAVDNSGVEAFDDINVSVLESKSNPVGASLIFSPNGDGVNDTWIVNNSSMILDCPLQIFNNLGQKVFEVNSYENDWNGYSHSQPLKEGDYYYVFECDSKKSYSGALRIIR